MASPSRLSVSRFGQVPSLPPQIVKKHKREYKILLQCQLKYLDVLGISNTYDIE